MGWYYTYGRGTHAEIDADQMKSWDNGNGTTSRLGDCKLVNRRHHWSVLYIDEVPTVIVLHLLDWDRARGMWGYKDMSEEMGPYYYDCPLSLLDKVPCPDSESARTWREGVREYHAKRKAQAAVTKGLKVGDVVTLREGLTVKGSGQVVRMAKRTPVVSFPGQGTYRVARTQIASVE